MCRSTSAIVEQLQTDIAHTGIQEPLKEAGLSTRHVVRRLCVNSVIVGGCIGVTLSNKPLSCWQQQRRQRNQMGTRRGSDQWSNELAGGGGKEAGQMRRRPPLILFAPRPPWLAESP